MSRRLFYILIGAVVLLLIGVGIATFIILPAVTSAKSAQAVTPTPTVSTPVAKAKANPVQQAIQQNAPAIKTQIAQGLHLTADQLKAELKGGQALDSIATAQGVSSEQLQTLIHDAFEQKLASAVSGGTVTQKQVDSYVVRVQKNHTALGRFLGAGGKKSSTATPVATPTPTVQ